MFTGIVEEIGTLRTVSLGSKSAVLMIEASKVLEGSKTGDSIAVNGVCLTITSLTADVFCADVMAETLRRSSLGTLRQGSRVNLERAMAMDRRFGGHIVSGHIDGTGTIIAMTREDNAVWVEIRASAHIIKYIIEKGSVAIDGISLTVAEVTQNSFRVSVIPHTGTETTLLEKSVGNIVNLENDIIGKYVDKLLHFPQEAGALCEEETLDGITLEFLEKNGF